MKIRNGFISNSSSSSFLIGTSDTSTLFGNKSSNDVIDYSVEDPTYYSLEDDYKPLTVGGAIELLNRNGFPQSINNLWNKIHSLEFYECREIDSVRSLLFNLAVKDNGWYWRPGRLIVDFYYIPKNLRNHFLWILQLAKRYGRFDYQDKLKSRNRNRKSRLFKKRRYDGWEYNRDRKETRGFYEMSETIRKKIDSLISEEVIVEVAKFVLKRLDEKYGINNLYIVEAGNEFDYDPNGHGGELESAIYRYKNYIVSNSHH